MYYVSRDGAPRGLRTELAKAMGCQAAYLTQVLAGNAELTEDHAFRLNQHLNLSDAAADYFMLLVRAGRASSLEFKNHLLKQAGALIKKNQDVQNKVQANKLDENEEFTRQYFGSWIPSTVHIATSSEKYKSAKTIARRLGIPEKQVLTCLQGLERRQLVKRAGEGQWEFAGAPLHLPKTSALNTNHQMHHRLQAIKALQAGSDEGLHFSSVFTLDKESFESIKALLLEAVEKTHKKIHAGGTDEIYAMSLDLFELV